MQKNRKKLTNVSFGLIYIPYSIKKTFFCFFFPKQPWKNLKNAHCWEKTERKLTLHYFRPTYIHPNKHLLVFFLFIFLHLSLSLTAKVSFHLKLVSIFMLSGLLTSRLPALISQSRPMTSGLKTRSKMLSMEHSHQQYALLWSLWSESSLFTVITALTHLDPHLAEQF